MSRLEPFLRPVHLFLGGALGLLASTPAWALSVGMPVTYRDWLLMGSLILLAVAVAMRIITRRGSRVGTEPDGPDLRWWHNA